MNIFRVVASRGHTENKCFTVTLIVKFITSTETTKECDYHTDRQADIHWKKLSL